MRRNGLFHQSLFNQMVQIYRQHHMQAWLHNNLPTLSQPMPIVICSTALI